MKKNVLISTIGLLLMICNSLYAQNNVGIGTAPNASAKLDVSSTTQGMLVPRMTTTQRNTITAPATGLMVYDITLNSFYFYNGTAWTAVGGGPASSINLGFGHLISAGTTVTYATPFSTVTANTLFQNLTFFSPNNVLLTINFYSFDDEPLTYELFEVTPVANNNTYTLAGTALASSTTNAWVSGVPASSSFGYNITAGKLYTIRSSKTGGGTISTSSAYFTSYSIN